MTIGIHELNAAALAALERSAFVFAEAAGESGDRPTELDQYVRIRCAGGIEGELYLGASDGFVRELAASLLGVDPEGVDPGVQGADALREMANMIAGSVILACGGATRAYTLGLPEQGERAGFEGAARSGLATTVMASGEPLRIVWRGRAPGVAAAA